MIPSRALPILLCAFQVIVHMFVPPRARGEASSEAPAIVVPLLAANSMLVGHYLPFQLRSNDGQAIELIDAGVSAVTGPACALARDPYWKSNVLVKCDATAKVLLNLRIQKGGQLFQLNYGPIDVVPPSSESLVIIPPKQIDVAQIQAGKAVYNGSCKACHDNTQITPAMLKDKTVADLKAKASATQSAGMRAAINALSDADLRLLETYLRNLEAAK